MAVSRMSLKSRQSRFYLFCTIPALAVIFVLFAYFLGQTAWMSLHSFTIDLRMRWVGLDNYARALADGMFWRSAYNNIIYTVVVVAASFLLGFAMALLMWRERKVNAVIKPIWMLPMLFIPASAALLWTFLYGRDFGLVNDLVSLLGMERTGWLGRPSTMLWAVMVTDVWAWTPFTFLILYAGLQSLPAEQFEAAAIDGANSWQQFWCITLPLLKPVIVIALALKGITTFRTFDYVWIMTAGGPNGVADVLSTLIYRTAFIGYRYGRASAMSILQLPVALPFILFYAYSLVGESNE